MQEEWYIDALFSALTHALSAGGQNVGELPLLRREFPLITEVVIHLALAKDLMGPWAAVHEADALMLSDFSSIAWISYVNAFHWFHFLVSIGITDSKERKSPVVKYEPASTKSLPTLLPAGFLRGPTSFPEFRSTLIVRHALTLVQHDQLAAGLDELEAAMQYWPSPDARYVSCLGSIAAGEMLAVHATSALPLLPPASPFIRQVLPKFAYLASRGPQADILYNELVKIARLRSDRPKDPTIYRYAPTGLIHHAHPITIEPSPPGWRCDRVSSGRCTRDLLPPSTKISCSTCSFNLCVHCFSIRHLKAVRGDGPHQCAYCERRSNLQRCSSCYVTLYCRSHTT